MHLVLYLIPLIVLARAATLYVDPASLGGDGSETSPVATLTQALNLTKTNDSVFLHLLPGANYQAQEDCNFPSSYAFPKFGIDCPLCSSTQRAVINCTAFAPASLDVFLDDDATGTGLIFARNIHFVALTFAPASRDSKPLNNFIEINDTVFSDYTQSEPVRVQVPSDMVPYPIIKVRFNRVAFRDITDVSGVTTGVDVPSTDPDFSMAFVDCIFQRISATGGSNFVGIRSDTLSALFIDGCTFEDFSVPAIELTDQLKGEVVIRASTFQRFHPITGFEMISLPQKSLTLTASLFLDSSVAAFTSAGQFANVESCLFKNITTSTYVFSLTSYSSFNLSSTTFQDLSTNSGAVVAVSIPFDFSQALIRANTFTNCAAQSGSGGFNLVAQTQFSAIDTEFHFEDNTFLNCRSQFSGGGSLSINLQRYAVPLFKKAAIPEDVSLLGPYTISDCYFASGSAEIEGGFIYVRSDPSLISTTTLIIANCEFDGGSAVGYDLQQYGGCVSVEGVPLEVYSSTFDRCSSTDHGGALAADNKLLVDSCTFNDCHGVLRGGCIYAQDESFTGTLSLEIRNTTFLNAKCYGAAALGGAVFASYYGTVVVDKSTFDNCSAVVEDDSEGTGGGGTIYVQSFTELNITSNTFYKSGIEGVEAYGAVILAQYQLGESTIARIDSNCFELCYGILQSSLVYSDVFTTVINGNKFLRSTLVSNENYTDSIIFTSSPFINVTSNAFVQESLANFVSITEQVGSLEISDNSYCNGIAVTCKVCALVLNSRTVPSHINDTSPNNTACEALLQEPFCIPLPPPPVEGITTVGTTFAPAPPSSRFVAVPLTATFNGANVTVTFAVPGETQSYNITIGVVRFSEISPSGGEVLGIADMPTDFNVSGPADNRVFANGLLQNGATVSFYYTYATQEKLVVKYGQATLLPQYTIKFSFEVHNWQFASEDNQLEVHFQAGIGQSLDATLNASSSTVLLEFESFLLVANILSWAVVDGAFVPQIGIKLGQVTVLTIPHFNDWAFVDPNFSVLYDGGEEKSDSGGPPIGVIVGVVVGVLVAVIIVAIILFVLHKKGKLKRLFHSKGKSGEDGL